VQGPVTCNIECGLDRLPYWRERMMLVMSTGPAWPFAAKRMMPRRLIESGAAQYLCSAAREARVQFGMMDKRLA
jgi:hypothetical protein